MRDALARSLELTAEHDARLVFLTGDLGFPTFNRFAERFGPRYLNVGIAEAQLVCAAAGMAQEGLRPVIYSIASFATGRCFEQLRVTVDYHALPVTIIGAGGGYTYGQNGVSHHAVEDLALMSALPNMTVLAPADGEEVEQLLPQLVAAGRPGYLRIGRHGEPTIVSDQPVQLGRARWLRPGGDVAVLCTGTIAADVVDAHAMLAAELRPTVVHFHTVKPFDGAAIEQLIADGIKAIVVVEEHLPQGGLWSAVSQWCALRNHKVRLERLGPDAALALGNFAQSSLKRRMGYDALAIAERCRSLALHRGSFGKAPPPLPRAARPQSGLFRLSSPGPQSTP